jgi:hypothetical protein
MRKAMADTKSKTDGRNRSRVGRGQNYEVSDSRARDLIRKHGNDRNTLEREAKTLVDMANGPNLLHNPHTPDVFADAATGIFTFNGCMRVTFESVRSNYAQTPAALDRVVVTRLVMPVLAAEAMAQSILAQVKRLRAEKATEHNANLQ